MSARKIDLQSFGKTQPSTLALTLPASAVQVQKNGIEFRHSLPITPWTEMVLALQGPGDAKKIECKGVIVGCSGSLAEGYVISMLFTDLSPQTRTRLLAYS